MASIQAFGTAAFGSVFQSPNWGINVLWLTIAALAQSVFVGQIGLFGWGAEQLSARSGRPEIPVPDIESGRLGDYISRGVWPFLVYFVVQLVGGLLMAVPLVGLVLLAAALGGDGGPPALAIGVLPLALCLVVALGIVSVPFLIRAMLCQDFSQSFDVAWVRQFVTIMFWDMLLGGIAFGFISAGVLMIGALMLCVGYLPAIGIVNGAGMNLCAQWYEVFLDRGGEPVPGPDPSIIDATLV